MHGTISDLGRAHYASALGPFADRAVLYHDAERAAARTGCARVSRSVGEISVAAMQTALRCLARLDASARTGSTGGWQGATVTLRGAVNAAHLVEPALQEHGPWRARRRRAAPREDHRADR